LALQKLRRDIDATKERLADAWDDPNAASKEALKLGRLQTTRIAYGVVEPLDTLARHIKDHTVRALRPPTD
jgi:hypothetical protein